jgi:hypothetical protein
MSRYIHISEEYYGSEGVTNISCNFATYVKLEKISVATLLAAKCWDHTCNEIIQLQFHLQLKKNSIATAHAI